MTNDFEKVFDTAAEPQDYTGEDGLLYCGSCRTPKEAYFPADKAALFGRDRHPADAPKWEWRTAMWSVGSR